MCPIIILTLGVVCSASSCELDSDLLASCRTAAAVELNELVIVSECPNHASVPQCSIPLPDPDIKFHVFLLSLGVTCDK